MTRPRTRLLSEDPFALLAGMMLDQQFPMERAFAGPAKIKERFGTLDPAAIATAPPEEFAAMCAVPPAVHRFPGSMAARLQALAQIVVDSYDGDAAALWNTADSGAEIFKRLTALPGFGKQKAQIFTALLGKQLGVRPDGWDTVAGVYAEEGSYRSVADVTDQASLEKVRSFKKEQKASREVPVNRPSTAADVVGDRLAVDVRVDLDLTGDGVQRKHPAQTPASTSDSSSETPPVRCLTDASWSGTAMTVVAASSLRV